MREERWLPLLYSEGNCLCCDDLPLVNGSLDILHQLLLGRSQPSLLALQFVELLSCGQNLLSAGCTTGAGFVAALLQL